MSRLALLISFLAVFFGGLIYLLFRHTELIFYRWVNLLAGGKTEMYLQSISLKLNISAPEWLVYSMPNALWAFAYALLMILIWAGSHSWLKYLWYSSIPLLIFGFEFLQGFQMIPGTYCLMDLTFGFLGISSGISTGFIILKYYNHEKVFQK
jgi:hypothetical protein